MIVESRHYQTADDAAKAYDRLALWAHGERAVLNFHPIAENDERCHT